MYRHCKTTKWSWQSHEVIQKLLRLLRRNLSCAPRNDVKNRAMQQRLRPFKDLLPIYTLNLQVLYDN